MRSWSILAAFILLPGCLSATSDKGTPIDDVAGAAARIVEGGMVEGTAWLEPSTGNERMEALVELPANFSGLRILADLALGSQYGPVELPATTADVLVEIRGSDGAPLAEGKLGATARAVTLEARTVVDGPHTLAILSYGGSDGEANGDHVHYHVDAKVA